MFEFQHEKLDQKTHKYSLVSSDRPAPYEAVLGLWQDEEEFVSEFVNLLRRAPFAAYRWETPPVTKHTISQPFEFVIVDSPELCIPADDSSFHNHLEGAAVDSAVVFNNLRNDAVLVVPTRASTGQEYAHLAEFLHRATSQQVLAIWQAVGREVASRLSSRPLWLSTAGGGVPWLHVRLDSYPKYYRHAPYRAVL